MDRFVLSQTGNILDITLTWILFLLYSADRLIKQNEEITITYGPNKDIAYKRRQERLNHYYFACNCKVCVEDSKKGFALKCRSCAGPVPFSSPVNDEPALNGQCLLCFTKYPGFEKCVADFYKYQQAVNVLDKLSSISSDNHDLLNMSTSCAKKLVDLFITPNPIINKSVLGLSTIIEKYQNEPVEELIEMGFLVDDNLLLDIPLDEIKHNTLVWYPQRKRLADGFFILLQIDKHAFLVENLHEVHRR